MKMNVSSVSLSLVRTHADQSLSQQMRLNGFELGGIRKKALLLSNSPFQVLLEKKAHEELM